MVFERKSEPEFRMGPSRKRTKKEDPIWVSFAARGSKTDLKMEPEIYENRSLPYFFIIKNTTKFQKHFFLDFPAFRKARTLKIKPNQKRKTLSDAFFAARVSKTHPKIHPEI